MSNTGDLAANLVPLLVNLGQLAVERHARKKLAAMDEAEALRQIAAATAEFKPKPSAEALAEGAAAAGGVPAPIAGVEFTRDEEAGS